MAHQWTIKRGQKEHGPVSSAQLRKLAIDGKLKPSDLIRRNATDKWRKASSVAGLFSQANNASDETAAPESETPPSLGFREWYRTKWMSRQMLPVQLWLWMLYGFLWIPIWYFRSPNTNKRQVVWFVSGFVALLIFSSVSMHMQRGKVGESVTAAHQLWDEGKQSEAVANYRDILKSNLPFVDDKDRTLLFERTITFDAENGNSAAAFELLDKANSNNVIVTSSSPMARKVIAEWRTEREQARAKKEELAEQQQSSEKDKKPAGKLSLTGWFSGGKLVDFLDNTEKYKGYVVTIDADYVGKNGLAGWMEDGEFATNVSCPFDVGTHVGGNWVSAKLIVTIPAGTKTAPIRSFEDARIKFRCLDGSLTYGNYAISVERP